MSKQKKKKKNNNHQQTQKKNKSVRSSIFAAAVVCGIIAAIVVGVIVYNNVTNITYEEFVGKTMHSKAAYDSSGKEVDLKEVYNNRYDNYQGSLEFNEDETFSMWMTVGSEDDATGTYTYSGGDVIKGKFKNGSEIEFKIIRDKDDNFTRIEAPYEGYTIYFS